MTTEELRLLDEFAASALTGLLALDADDYEAFSGQSGTMAAVAARNIAIEAYNLAKWMLVARREAINPKEKE